MDMIIRGIFLVLSITILVWAIDEFLHITFPNKNFYERLIRTERHTYKIIRNLQEIQECCKNYLDIIAAEKERASLKNFDMNKNNESEATWNE